MLTLASTFWKCPECKTIKAIDGTELATIGTPFCDCRDEQEMDPVDDPIPTIVYIDDGEDNLCMGIGLRFNDMTPIKFEAKIKKLWKKYMQSGRFRSFAAWSSELDDGVLFLANENAKVSI